MKNHPLARAVRVDKLTLAALEATLRLYRDPERAKAEIPTLRMLAADKEQQVHKAERLIELLGHLAGEAAVADCDSQVGGGSVPLQALPSAAVAVRPESMSPDELDRLLRGCEIPIVARISHDRLLLDMRTLEEKDLAYIAGCLQAILGGPRG